MIIKNIVFESMSTKSSQSLDPNEVPEDALVNFWHSAFEYMCKRFVGTMKFSLFKNNYKDAYKKDPKKLKAMHEQLCAQLTTSVTEDLNETYKEHTIEFLLNSLDAVIKKYKDLPQQISWRPSGNPNEDLRDHIYPIKMKYKEHLQGLLTKLSINNEVLISTSAIKHAEILQLKESNDDMHQELSNIVSLLTGPEFKKLQNTLKSEFEMEEE